MLESRLAQLKECAPNKLIMGCGTSSPVVYSHYQKEPDTCESNLEHTTAPSVIHNSAEDHAKKESDSRPIVRPTPDLKMKERVAMPSKHDDGKTHTRDTGEFSSIRKT